MTKYKIGILAIQGAFHEHRVALLKAITSSSNEVDMEIIEVRMCKDLTFDMDGLIIPGGESTTISLFLQRNNMTEVLKEWIRSLDHATWGTCAGMILLAEKSENHKKGGQSQLGGLGVIVSRNYFGRQVNSFEADLVLHDSILKQHGPPNGTCRGIFIRAPAILDVTDGDTKVLATLETGSSKCDDHRSVIVAARHGNILATAFHPELTEDLRWHRYFLTMIDKNKDRH